MRTTLGINYLLAALALVELPLLVAQKRPDLSELRIVPAKVYKVDDPGHQETETATFNVVVMCNHDDCNSKPTNLKLELFSGSVLVGTEESSSAALEKLALTSYRIPEVATAASARRNFMLNEAFDLRLIVTRPKKLTVDRARITLSVSRPGGREDLVAEFPILVYQQKTALIFPFRGPALVVQGWANDGGHAGHANQFAIDVLGLDPNYAPQVNDKDENTSYAGWDREIIAPADGTVVYARNDVPNNSAASGPDQRTLDSQHDPVLAVAGNCVIINHGNSEFSVMMHMREGSVTVKAGQHVTQGQVIGRLGNSGDSFGPHLHYQLQSGPDLFRDPSIPFTFQNVNRAHLFRGTYFHTK